MHLNNIFRVLLAVLAVAFSSSISAQEVPNQKVTASLEQQELESLTNEDIQLLNFISESSYIVSYMPEKANNLPDLKLKDPSVTHENINPLLLEIDTSEGHQRYRIGNSGYVALFYSDHRIDQLYQRAKINASPNAK